jgi:hypothetical protein
VVAPPSLYSDPPTSPEDSDDNDDPDYEPLNTIHSRLIGSDKSVSRSLPAFSSQSTSFSNQSLPRESPDASHPDNNSNFSYNPPETEHQPPAEHKQRGRPNEAKNKPDTWKTTLAQACKLQTTQPPQIKYRSGLNCKSYKTPISEK